MRQNRDIAEGRLGRRPGTVMVMIKPRMLVLAVAGLLLTACSQTSTAEGGGGSSLPKTLFLGDSVAVGEAQPMTAAFKAAGAGFESIAAEGGGNVVGPFSEKSWPDIEKKISSAKPGLVIYQSTSYDWGSEEEQKAGYEKLVLTARNAGAKTMFVTMPPIKADDFYKDHMTELAQTAEVARTVADGSGGQAVALDASPVWGSQYVQNKDGKADRSSDGIHTCPQGAARFTQWLLTELTKQYPDFHPAAPDTWANTGWSADGHFKGC